MLPFYRLLAATGALLSLFTGTPSPPCNDWSLRCSTTAIAAPPALSACMHVFLAMCELKRSIKCKQVETENHPSSLLPYTDIQAARDNLSCGLLQAGCAHAVVSLVSAHRASSVDLYQSLAIDLCALCYVREPTQRKKTCFRATTRAVRLARYQLSLSLSLTSCALCVPPPFSLARM